MHDDASNPDGDDLTSIGRGTPVELVVDPGRPGHVDDAVTTRTLHDVRHSRAPASQGMPATAFPVSSVCTSPQQIGRGPCPRDRGKPPRTLSVNDRRLAARPTVTVVDNVDWDGEASSPTASEPEPQQGWCGCDSDGV